LRVQNPPIKPLALQTQTALLLRYAKLSHMVARAVTPHIVKPHSIWLIVTSKIILSRVTTVGPSPSRLHE